VRNRALRGLPVHCTVSDENSAPAPDLKSSID